MSNAFTNFLGGVVSGIFNSPANLKDYQHANRTYVRDNYQRSPKLSFLYYIVFNINPAATKSNEWNQKKKKDVGILVKKIDIPRFTVNTDVLNQYNRKTVIQTGIKYNPVSVEFHDDSNNITSGLWENYYKYYYADSAYDRGQKLKPESFSDTKYGSIDYAYGLNHTQTIPFFESVDIYVLHQKQFTQYTLLNPIITEWAYDNLNQDENGKTLTSRMQLAYENVLFRYGRIQKGAKPEGFSAVYYDTQPSPLSIGGKGTSSLFGPGGVIAGADSLLGILGKENKSPLDFLQAAIQAKNLSQNIKNLSKAGLKQEGFSILKGALGNISATNNQPNGAGGIIRDAINSNNLGALGRVGVNIFNNTSVANTTIANAKKILGGGGG